MAVSVAGSPYKKVIPAKTTKTTTAIGILFLWFTSTTLVVYVAHAFVALSSPSVRNQRPPIASVRHGTISSRPHHLWSLEQCLVRKQPLEQLQSATLDSAVTSSNDEKELGRNPQPLLKSQPHHHHSQAQAQAPLQAQNFQPIQKRAPPLQIYKQETKPHQEKQNQKEQKQQQQHQQEPSSNNIPNEDRPRDVQFVSPLLEYGYLPTVEEYEANTLSEKPLLIYLPGFDGTYICPFLQFPELGEDFDVRCMTVSMRDRSTFDELKQAVLDFLVQELQEEVDDDDEENIVRPADNENIKLAKNGTVPRHDWWSGMFKLWPKGSTGTASSSTKIADTTTQSSTTMASTTTTTTPEVATVSSSSSSSPSSSYFPMEQPVTTNGAALPTTTPKVRPKKLRTSQRHVYLAGESFGGILACEVALTVLKQKQPSKEKQDAARIQRPRDLSRMNLQGLALINAATCYDRSQLASKGPPVANLPPLLYPFGLMVGLLPLFTDDFSWEQLLLILQAKALPSVIDTPAREAFMGRVAFSLPFMLKYMPQSTLQWRLTEWLAKGCARLVDDPLSSSLSPTTAYTDNAKRLNYDGMLEEPQGEVVVNTLEDFKTVDRTFRTVIIAGEKDLALPSIAEAERLAHLLPNSYVHVVEGAGHSSTCGSRIDLAAVLRNRFRELESPKSGQRRQGTQRSSKTANGAQSSSTSTSTTKSGGDKDKSKTNKGDQSNTSKVSSGGKDTPAYLSTTNALSSASQLPGIMEKKRIAMKDTAAKEKGVRLGLEPRYDGADIGLNPLRYWSKKYYRPVVQKPIQK
jgi:pimeloyl-ACP methyl ester carboxylesterase